MRNSPCRQKRFGIDIGRVNGPSSRLCAAVAAPADDETEGNPGTQSATAQGIPRFHETGILDDDQGFPASSPKTGRDGHGLAFAAWGDEAEIRIIPHGLIKKATLAVGNHEHMGKFERLYGRKGLRGANSRSLKFFSLVSFFCIDEFMRFHFWVR